jgi:cytochrome c oxidase assembly factor CtaG
MRKPVQRGWQALTDLLVAWSFQAAALWIWQGPRLFQADLESEPIHILQYLCSLVAALLFWWFLILGHPGVRGYDAAVMSVFTTSLQFVTVIP